MPPRHISQLDGLRCLAVMLVLLAHSTVAFAYVPLFRWTDAYGSLGVQLFFVLSGFLITRILLDTKDSTNFFRNFYMRRALRIYPLYYALLLLVMFSGAVHQHGVTWWPYALFVSNEVYRHVATQPAPLGPVWSLAVEEQFYLVWPLLVAAVPRKWLPRVCLLIIASAVCLRLTGWMQLHTTLIQLDALVAGGLIACGFEQLAPYRRYARLVACLLPLGVTLKNGLWNDLSQTLQVAGAVALLIVLLDDRALLSKWLRARPFRFVGKISYGVYLLHSLIFAWFLRSSLYRYAVQKQSLAVALFYLLAETALAIGVATLSFYLFETPFLRLKRFFESSPVPRRAADQSQMATAEVSEPALLSS